MSEKFIFEIITPEKTLIKSETKEEIIPSYEGEIGILKDHIPLITFLRPGIIYVKNEKEIKYFVEEGTVEFVNNNLLILTSSAIEVEKLKSHFIDESIEKAEENINKSDFNDKEKYLLSYKIETLKELRK